MDFSRNVTLSGGLPSEYEPEQLFSPPCSKLGSLDDLFSGNNTEGDVNLEWLSIFVEDCLSSSGNCLPPVAILPPQVAQNKTNISTASKIIPKAEPSKPRKLVKSQKSPSSSSPPSILQKFVIPGRARSKRKWGPIGNKAQRSIISAHHLQMSGSDPLLLQQVHWLADSELILPKNEENNYKSSRGIIRARNEEMKEEANNVIMEKEEGRMGSLEGSNGQQQPPRRCSHCLAQRTPQWRAGPLGPITLCNACGVRYKSGRLLPEYRPAKSPTFVSHKHSNSHKKVLEMRTTSFLSSSS